MLAASPEQNRHKKGDNRSETNPPREFHYRQPVRLRVKARPKYPGDVVWQSAQDRDYDEADDHGDNIAAIVAASFGENSAEKTSRSEA
jgi:hypothetical protein